MKTPISSKNPTPLKTAPRSTAFALGCLTLGAGLPFAGVPEAAAQALDGGRGIDRAIAAQREAVEEQTRPAERARALNDLANLLELSGDVEGAYEQYGAAIAADGSLAPAHYNLALLAYATGESELALDHLETALELDPGNAWAHYQLGRIADEAGDAEAAVERYVRALSLDTRLAFTDVNPHFAVNRYATEVLLKADRSRSEALPPRRYSQPARITGLLLPEAPPESPLPETPVAAEGAGERRASDLGDRPPGAERPPRVIESPESPLARDEPPKGLAGGFQPLVASRVVVNSDRGAAEAAPSEEEPEEAPRRRETRVFTRDDLRTRTLAGGSAFVAPPAAASPKPPAGGGIRPGTAVGPGGRQSTPPAAGTFRGGGRFQPSARSSAQLETTIRRRAVPAP